MYFEHLSNELAGKPTEAPDFYKWEDEFCQKELSLPVKMNCDLQTIISDFLDRIEKKKEA